MSSYFLADMNLGMYVQSLFLQEWLKKIKNGTYPNNQITGVST